MIAPITHHMHDFNNAPVLQFAQARAHVRPRQPQLFTDLLRMQRLFSQIQQRVNLRHGPV